MSKNIVAIYAELVALKKELERMPSADVQMLGRPVGVYQDEASSRLPRPILPVSAVRQALNDVWTHLNEAEKLLADMEVAP